MPVRYRQSSSTRATVIPAAGAGSGTPGQESGSCRAGAERAAELGQEQPRAREASAHRVLPKTQMLGERVANAFPSLGSLNGQREDEEAAGEEGATSAWPCIPPQHLSPPREGNK